ncbi:MAG TPA: hypothetical protein VHE81_04070, partial [Lacipirellulaceae bacterium]|nr:hypothetical protein [Lacipirellulaceae bacterium]
MYNPASPENLPPNANWEWVEVLNNTGSAINFASTPYVIDDISGANLTQPNISSGSIPNGGVAVLFNDDAISVADMQAAWGNSINFIPVDVTDFSLNNTQPSATSGGGDTFGIWSNMADYNTDSAGSTRAFVNAAASIDYDISSTSFPNAWPDDDGKGSIYLKDLSLDPTVGSNWALASLGDGLSYSPNQLTGTITLHPGGDVGSPGDFTPFSPSLDGDFNGDNKVDAADYVIWRKGGSPNPNSAGDYNLWRTHFGETAAGSGSSLASNQAVPEPASLV